MKKRWLSGLVILGSSTLVLTAFVDTNGPESAGGNGAGEEFTLSLATPDADAALEFEALGMESVDMPILETYEALQRGVVTCMGISQSTVALLKLQEVAPYQTYLTDLGGQVLPTLNKSIFDSMPDDLQGVMIDAGVEWSVDYTIALIADMNLGQFQPGGAFEETVEISFSPEMEEQNLDHQAEIIEGLSKNPPAGLTTEQAQNFVADYKASVMRTTEELSEAGWDTSPTPTTQDGFAARACEGYEKQGILCEFLDDQVSMVMAQ